MSIRKWTAIGLAGTAAILAITMLPNDRERVTEREHTAAPTPRQEQQLKQMMLQQDLDATSHLARLDARRHLRLLTKNFENTPMAAANETRKIQKTHAQLLEVIHVRNSATDTRIKQDGFKANGENRTTINMYIKLAKKAIQQGKPYESPSFPEHKPLYFVVAEPCSKPNQGVIGIFSMDIMAKVQNHQQKNLRLIPYPKEGRFKVESVHTDTLQDIKVRTGHDNEKASHFYENEIVVTFHAPPSVGDLSTIRKDLHCGEGQKIGNTYIFHSDNKSMHELAAYFKKKWKPKYVEPHYLYLTNEQTSISEQGSEGINSETPNDLLYSDYQWNLPITKTNLGWRLSKGNGDVVVAVIDTGVDLDHPDLQGRVLSGYNVINPQERPMDDVGHGTHVAGIISAQVNNEEGIAGMTWNTKILPVKALDASGSGTTYSVAQGIIWATDKGAKVINLSLGNYADAQFLHEAIKYAYDRDVVVIGATGNDNTERPGYPAAYPEVLSVSATDSAMKRASFSNYGDYVDVMAPGQSIASTYPNNQYAALSGTSMATPHVAALAALIRSVNPDLRNTEVMEIIRKNVTDLGSPGHDKYFGYGQIDVYSALQAAGGGQAPLQLWPQYTESKLNDLKKSYVK